MFSRVPWRSFSVSLAAILLAVISTTPGADAAGVPKEPPVVGTSSVSIPTGAQSGNDVIDPEFLGGLSYRMVGPHRGGRSTAVSGVVGHPHLFYMGTTGGGVWRTDDAGETWANVSDGQFEVGGVGAVAVAPSDPNVIYIGTGSACIRGNVSPGRGVYRSTDAGATWTHIGLRDAGQIGKVVVDPRDPDLVFVAALGNPFGPNEERGLFRSRDGGGTWENVLHIDNVTGVVDLSMHPTNPRILYAGAWRGERKPWTLISGNEEAGIFKSTDGGDNWSKLEGGLPQGLVGKTAVAVSPAEPNRVWALVEHGEQGGLYRSEDAGTSWRLVSGEHGLFERAWYYMHITPDPTDENTVWISNVFLYKSTDGGANFTIVPTAHGDNHALWINPDNTDIMINGDDGGGAVTLNGGRTWSSLRNQPTAEIYRVTVDNQFPYRIYGSQQDNSTVSVPSRLPPGMISDHQEEYQFGGCESGHVAVDPRDPNIIYSGCYGGTITRFDKRTGQQRDIIAYPQLQLGQMRQDLEYRFQWNAPIRISPHDPDVIYHTSQVVLRSSNGGQSWDEISPDLTTDDPEHQDFSGGPITRDGTGVEVYGTVFAFEESPHEAGVLWSGSDDGRLHVSRNGGSSWDDVTPPMIAPGATINSIDISAHDPDRVLIAAYKYREADFSPYIYKTDDGGATWASLADGSNGIPADHFVRVVREDPDRSGLLYAGTEFGMYVSFDDGSHWQSMQLNLPVTPVTDLLVHQQDLVLSTQGRSFWVLDDLTPLHELSAAATAEAGHLFSPADAHRIASGGFGFNGGRRAQDAPSGAVIYYSVGEGNESPVELSITDASGDLVQTFSSEGGSGPDLGALAIFAEIFGFGLGGGDISTEPGLHRFVWNLRYPAPRPPRGAVIFGLLQGPVASPGTYTVELTVGDSTSSRQLTVLADPRVEVTQAEFDAQFSFLKDVGAEIERTAGAVSNLRAAREQSAAVAVRAADAGLDDAVVTEIREASEALAEKLTAIEEELVQTRSRSFEDPLNYPGKLYAQLANLQAHVNGGFGAVDAPPTDGALRRLADLRAQLDGIAAQLDEVLVSDVAAFNERVEAAGVPAIVIKR